MNDKSPTNPDLLPIGNQENPFRWGKILLILKHRKHSADASQFLLIQEIKIHFLIQYDIPLDLSRNKKQLPCICTQMKRFLIFLI